MREWNNRVWLAFAIVFILTLYILWNPFAVNPEMLYVSSLAILMISFWLLEVIPMPITALFPLVILPILGLGDISSIAKSYADPIIFLFMGGFFLAIAIEKWKLHKRIALSILKITGSNGNQIILGFMLATFFISMWISNTATTMMMYPIALSVLTVVSSSIDKKQIQNLNIAIMLSIAYASNLGGITTIIGTPPNVAYLGFIKKELQIDIPFWKWMLMCFPIGMIILGCLYVIIVKILLPNTIQRQAGAEEFITREKKLLGQISLAEKRVLIVFVTTALCWLFKDFIVQITGLAINDTIIALCCAISLFMIPSGQQKLQHDEMTDETSTRIASLLTWEDTRQMAWGILILFGGGLALAKALETAGVMKLIGDFISVHAPSNILLLIIIVTTVSIFLSEVLSNIAQVIVMAPIITSMAVAMQIHPLILGLPMTLAASCAGMLPMGTPPNAIVYASGKIPLSTMLKTGLVLNLISIIVISFASYMWRQYF